MNMPGNTPIFAVGAIALLVVALLQVGAWSTVAGVIVRGEGPAPVSAAHLPPSGATSRGDLAASPRRSELVDVPRPGSAAPIRTWVVYPERSPAPVVVVVHDLYALSNWVRSIADALAAEGFVAVAPDLFAGATPGGFLPSAPRIEPRARTSWLDAVGAWARGLPAADGRLGLVGFSWGGAAAFAYAVDRPELDALVVFYGETPEAASDYARIDAPALGLYGGDLGTAATLPRAEAAMAAAGKPFETIVYDGATVFLKAQEGLDANRRATEDAWPRTLAFLRRHLAE
ncbi:MAG: dienelactone hydrolase family protein [Acidobacteria bacterium]|nr:dienelactone hydrolase family protein [Acidobacteriota bacterium]